MKKRKFTGKAFHAQVVETARLYGWLCHDVFEAAVGPAGFPDLIMLRGRRMLAVWLATNIARVSKARQVWLAAFAELGGNVEAVVWRPSDLVSIARDIR
jgi:hypothetical protein